MDYTLYIKNMVCNRCILVIKKELNNLNFNVISIKLGEVTINKEPNSFEIIKLDNVFNSLGFELIDDRKSKVIEKIKTIIIEILQQNEIILKKNLSDILSEKLHRDYNYLSNLFSELEGNTIERFFILQKIEKVKELLSYNQLSLSEIAFRLNYSSSAYLSNQFKKETGFTPSFFKQHKSILRKPLDQI